MRSCLRVVTFLLTSREPPKRIRLMKHSHVFWRWSKKHGLRPPNCKETSVLNVLIEVCWIVLCFGSGLCYPAWTNWSRWIICRRHAQVVLMINRSYLLLQLIRISHCLHFLRRNSRRINVKPSSIRGRQKSCFRFLKFNPWMEIAGKYFEMSAKSPKLNRHKVSLKSWGIEVKCVLDCSAICRNVDLWRNCTGHCRLKWTQTIYKLMISIVANIQRKILGSIL